MPTTKQVHAARSSRQKARPAARSQRTVPHQSRSAKSVVPSQGAAVATRKRSGSSLKTRAELYELAKKKELPGRSLMGRDELAAKLGIS